MFVLHGLALVVIFEGFGRLPSDLLCLSCSKNSRALEEATQVSDGIAQQMCHDFCSQN